jgi:hypothetical protein
MIRRIGLVQSNAEAIPGAKGTLVRFALRLLQVLLVAVFGTLGLLIVLWLLTFVDPAPAQDDCAFGSVSKAEYLQLLRQAKAQDWTVWPGLSNGLFSASERVPSRSTLPLESSTAKELRKFISELTPADAPADQQLAAAHALMRSIGAEYVRVSNVPDFRKNGQITTAYVNFQYFLPQRRFAPLCLFCLIWRYTTIAIAFRHEIAAGTYALRGVNVAHSGLDYDPEKTRNIADACPAFPGAAR